MTAGTEGWPVPLSARFTVHRPLGRGRFGAVFEATDGQRGALVAVKVLAVDRPEALQAFKREFRALADLAHENLVALHELGRAGDTWFLVMERIEGHELLAGLACTPARTLNVFAQIALGLGFLHAAGRLHRDLKPANVRLTPGGRAVLLDFGLTVVRGALEGDEGLVGSAAYVSPEQAAGGDASGASDLYALGVMLCEALLGRRPFVGSGLEVLAAKRATEPKLEWPATVPPPVRELVQRLLSRDPAQRPTIEQVVATLDDSLVPLLELRPEVPLVGRDEALATLHAEVSPAVPSAVWVTAAPGVGKSALLRRFMSTLERDAVVLASTCFEHETTPFRAVDGVVDGVARWFSSRDALPPELATHAANLARSFPALKHVRCVKGVSPSASLPEAHRHESALALRALLTFIAEHHRVVVVVDDLHWADADSVPLLRELLQGAAPAPLLFVGAMREEGNPLLEPLLRELDESIPGARRRQLRLAPLSPEASRALIAALAPGASDTAELLHAAAGNPFLLHTLAGHGGALEAAVEARVARVPRASRRLLEAVCLTGAPLPRKTWSLAGALDIDEALALGHLRAGRLVRVRGDGALEPYHDSLRRAVVGTLAPATRVERHGGLAEALRGAGAEPELLAEHLHGAGRTMEAAEQAVLAARRAAETLAFHHAARLYGQALNWLPPGDETRALLVARGRALANVGRGEEAADAFLRASERASSAKDGGPTTLELEQLAAAQLLRTGRIDRGMELTQRVLAANDLSLPATPRSTLVSLAWTRLRLELRGWSFKRRAAKDLDPLELARIDVLTSSSIGLAAVDSLRAADLMGRALLRALNAGEPRRLAVCLGFETAFSGNGGGAAYARTMLVRDHATRLANELGDDYALACCLGGAGIAYFHLGQLKDAIEHLDRASSLFLNCVGAVKELFTLQLFALAALAQQGELGELGRRLGDHVRLATERGDRYAESNLRSGLPNLAWLAVDDVARARRELELARPGLETRGYSVQHFFELLGRFQLELYAGEGAAAHVLDEGLPALEGALLSRTEWIAIAIDWMKGRARLSSGTADLAPVLTSAARIEKRKRPWGDALAMSLRAGVHARRGDDAEATAALEAVARLATAAELKLHALAAERLLAQRSGRAPEALDTRARAMGVHRLAAMTRVYVPGFEPSRG